jgi:hypothetical protein
MEMTRAIFTANLEIAGWRKPDGPSGHTPMAARKFPVASLHPGGRLAAR